MKALVVSKNLVSGVRLRESNPMRLVSEDGQSEVWVYHQLEIKNQFWQPLPRAEIERDTGMELEDFDAIAVYIAAQGILHVGRIPAAFPIEERALRELPAGKMRYFSSDDVEKARTLLLGLGHREAALQHVESGGSDSLGEFVQKFLTA